MHRTLRDLWTMKRNPIDWSCVANGLLVDTSALSFTFIKKCGIRKDSEKIQNKTLRTRRHWRVRSRF